MDERVREVQRLLGIVRRLWGDTRSRLGGGNVRVCESFWVLFVYISDIVTYRFT